MNGPADRGNRVVLTLLGLLLLAAGGLGLALSYDAFGAARAHQPLLPADFITFVDRNAAWLWPLAAVAAVVVGLLALRWLVRQFATARVRTLDLEPDPTDGATTVAASAVTDAVAEEIQGYRGVTRASARLVGDEHNHDLVLAVGVDERADLGALRRRIEEQAVGHTRQALGEPRLPVHLHIQLTTPPRQRVR